jgi:hypothetical protein
MLQITQKLQGGSHPKGRCIMRERPRKYLVEYRWPAEGS